MLLLESQIIMTRGKPAQNERVHFRLIHTPCCGHMLCWVNPRLPTYCPECGTMIISQLKQDGSPIVLNDMDAWIRYHS